MGESSVILRTAMIASFFDINNIFFTLWDYPMSYLEFFGTLFNIVTVWLCARKNIWNWPVGIAAVVLFAVLFYQIQLYSDFLEQIYYFITGFWGWWVWLRLKKDPGGGDQGETISRNTFGENVGWGAVIVFGTIVLGAFMARIDVIFPQWFPEAASFPYLDAFTTVAAFVAQVLLVRQRIENWYLWIVIDVIGVWLYFEKEVKFVSVLYFIFLIIATNGLLHWRKAWQKANAEKRIAIGEEVPAL